MMQRTLRSFLLLAGLLIFAKPSYGQVPSLGAVASYALFTKTGAVSNTGTNTVISGDVGTNVGAMTGYNSVDGQQHVADDATQRASVAVVDAYNYLVALPRGASIGPVLGPAQTIPPGVYTMDAASSVAGNVILDGQNKPDSYFIFKIGGAFSVAAASNITLINSASSANVFWQVYGAASVAANSHFVGTIIADGAVDLGDGVSLNGRALSIVGAISTYNNFVGRPAIGASAAPLPVSLTGFDVERLGCRAQLRWATATEKNNAYFAVESSTDGKVFAEVGRVAGHGSSTQLQAYTWAETLTGHYSVAVLYYRLRQVDSNGDAVYSSVRTLSLPASASNLLIEGYPNPAKQEFNVRVVAPQAGLATLRFFNSRGTLVAEQQLAVAAGNSTLRLADAENLSPGLYRVQLQLGKQHQTCALVRE